MRMASAPWHGVLVANPVALDSRLEVDYDRYGEHVASACRSPGATASPRTDRSASTRR